MIRPSTQISQSSSPRLDILATPAAGSAYPKPPLQPIYSESSEQLKQALFTNLYCEQGKDEQFANAHDYYMALAYSVRNELMKKRIRTATTYADSKAKAVYYL